MFNATGFGTGFLQFIDKAREKAAAEGIKFNGDVDVTSGASPAVSVQGEASWKGNTVEVSGSLSGSLIGRLQDKLADLAGRCADADAGPAAPAPAAPTIPVPMEEPSFPAPAVPVIPADPATDGNDVIYGTAGADAMYGGLGNDTYYVNHADDRAYELPGQGNDTVISTVTYSLAGQVVENLTLTGSDHINATGNTLHNKLIGNAGSNLLDGGALNDVLNGKGGSDVLTGGTGKDAFVFDTAAQAGGDVITDFQNGFDLINLANIDADTNAQGNQSFTFIGTERFHNVAGELHVYHSNGDAYVSGDTDGDGRADFAIKALGYHTFANADFVL